jgi:hypothetical protein
MSICIRYDWILVNYLYFTLNIQTTRLLINEGCDYESRARPASQRGPVRRTIIASYAPLPPAPAPAPFPPRVTPSLPLRGRVRARKSKQSARSAPASAPPRSRPR